MEKIISNYIKYKYTFNNNIKYSSYSYQKIFRSIYGYTQNVSKNSKKIYQYYRKGIIDDIPYIRPGKNSIIIPINTEHKLIQFFNTGKSTTHNFKEKGDYIVEYTIDKIDINDTDIIRCLENFIDYLQITAADGNNKKLYDELNLLVNDSDYFNKYKKANKTNLLKKIKHINSIDWFIKCKDKTEKINTFTDNINILIKKIEELSEQSVSENIEKDINLVNTQMNNNSLANTQTNNNLLVNNDDSLKNNFDEKNINIKDLKNE